MVQLELGGVKDNNSRLLTKVVEGPQASERLVQPIEECEWLYGCSSFGSLNLLGRLVGKSLTKILNKRNDGKHKGVRWIGKIDTKEDIEIVKDYLHIGLEIKHVNSIPVNFIVTDKEFNL